MLRLPSLAFAGLLVGALAGAVRAQTPARPPVIADARGRVTVTATDLPLGDLLRELARYERLELRVALADRERPVRVSVTDVSAYEAVMAVLKASGANFVVTDHRAADGLTARVWVGALSSAPPLLEAAADDPDRRHTTPAPAQVTAAPETTPVRAADDPDRSPAARVGGVVGGRPSVAAGQGRGEVGGPQIVQMLTGTPSTPRSETVALPFPAPNGQPLTVPRESATPRGFVELPFPDEAGRPLLAPITPSGVPAGWIELPFPGPDGSPMRVPSAPAGAGSAPVRPPPVR